MTRRKLGTLLVALITCAMAVTFVSALVVGLTADAVVDRPNDAEIYWQIRATRDCKVLDDMGAFMLDYADEIDDQMARLRCATMPPS